MNLKNVIIESPYKAESKEELDTNITYAKEAMRHSLYKGEAPFLSHLLYTQVLNDNVEMERNIGIKSGTNWYKSADKCIVYADLGISSGMEKGIDKAIANDVEVEIRYIRE